MICTTDSFCCISDWDIICAGLAEKVCGEETVCAGDLDGSGEVDVADLVLVVLDWDCSAMPGQCAGDANGDGIVDVGDMVFVILGWGLCP